MGEFKRKSDGRRIFPSDFKRATIDRIRSGAARLAELSSELEIIPTILRNWLRLVVRGGKAAVEAGEEVVAFTQVRELEKQVHDLQRRETAYIEGRKEFVRAFIGGITVRPDTGMLDLPMKKLPARVPGNSTCEMVAGARYEPLQIEMRPLGRFLAGLRRVA